MPMGIGLPEMIIVLVLALIVLGPKKLPSAGRSLGNGMREFKSAITGGSDEKAEAESEADALERRNLPTAA